MACFPASPEYWAERWTSHINREAYANALLLMVAHSGNVDEMMPEQRSNLWADWCLEQGFEFLEADMETSVGAALGAGRGQGATRSLLEQEAEADREQGKQRVLDALRSHMWSSMARKQHVASAVAQVAAAEHEREETTEQAGDGPADDDDKQHYIDFDEYTQMVQQAEKEHDLQSMDAFERALNSAREMREHAMSLPDEQRKEFAAKFALQLLALMGDLDEEDDSAEEEMK
jgi:hypothetical protein